MSGFCVSKDNKRLPRLLTTLIPLFILGSCALKQHTYHEIYQTGEVIQAEFKHLIIRNYGTEPITNRLIVFLEGDGHPWIDGQHIAKDPTPTQPVSLTLWQQTQEAALFLGRPCYYTLTDPECHYRYWTSHRYSPEVVLSLHGVIERELKLTGAENVTLIGHSGGGVLATLLACKLSVNTILVTMGANLDTDAWAAHHGWTTLSGSLNPISGQTTCHHVHPIHFQGLEDSVVPPDTAAAYFAKVQQVPIRLPSVDHHNWLEFWPNILNHIESAK